MKFLEKLPSCDQHSSNLKHIISEDIDFHIARNDEYSNIHDFLEEEAMELGNFINLRYSRRPNLTESYLESLQIPGLITDKKNNFFGVVSVMSVYRNGEERKIYYTSDLRISKRAGIRVRINFRKMYLNILRQIDADCFTVVLKENQKAINALTKNKNDLFYHPVHEYVSNSILVLPILRFVGNSLNNIVIKQKRDFDYEIAKKSNSSFSHGTSDSDTYFVLERDGETVGSFSISRPKNRSLKVEAKSKSMQMWIKLANIIFSHNYDKKIPWVYLTSFIISDDLDKSECMEAILSFLLKSGFINSGEIFLFCHDKKIEIKPKTFGPNFLTEGIFYKVSLNKHCEKFENSVYLNPICL